MRKEQNMPTIAMIVEEQRNLLPLTCAPEYPREIESLDSLTSNDELLDVKTFFKDGQLHGFFFKTEFLSYLERLAKNELIDVDRMFELTSKSYPINHSLTIEGEEKTDMCFIFCEFTLPNAKILLRIVFTPEIFHFLSCYQEGVNTGWRLLSDLVEEAMINPTEG